MLKFTPQTHDNNPIVRAIGCNMYVYKVCVEGAIGKSTVKLITSPANTSFNCDADGCWVVAWTPKAKGNYNFSIEVIDGLGNVEYHNWVVEVNDHCKECPKDCWATCEDVEAVKDAIPTNEEICALIQPKIDDAIANADIPTNEEICELIQPKIDTAIAEVVIPELPDLSNYVTKEELQAAWVMWCQKLVDQTAEVQAIIDNLDSTEPVAEPCVTCPQVGQTASNPVQLTLDNLPAGQIGIVVWDTSATNPPTTVGTSTQTTFTYSYGDAGSRPIDIYIVDEDNNSKVRKVLSCQVVSSG